MANSRLSRWRMIALALAVCALYAPFASAEDPKLRLLVITGSHAFDPSFYSLFEGYPDIEWEKKVQTDKPCAAFTPGFAEGYDVVLLYDFENKISEEQKANFLSAFGEGRGLIVLHHALCSHPVWKEFHDLAGGGFYFAPRGKKRASEFEADIEYETKIAAPDHPVARGLAPFAAKDEVYRYCEVDEGVTPLLATDHPKSGPILAWAKTHGKSRVVSAQPGHGPSMFGNASFRQFIAQAIRWTGGREP